jgi:hypothetical protein
MTALAMTAAIVKKQTRPLVKEGTPHQQTRNLPTYNNRTSLFER